MFGWEAGLWYADGVCDGTISLGGDLAMCRGFFIFVDSQVLPFLCIKCLFCKFDNNVGRILICTVTYRFCLRYVLKLCEFLCLLFILNYFSFLLW